VWQTDGQTDRQSARILIARPRLHFMQRGKKRSLQRAGRHKKNWTKFSNLSERSGAHTLLAETMSNIYSLETGTRSAAWLQRGCHHTTWCLDENCIYWRHACSNICFRDAKSAGLDRVQASDECCRKCSSAVFSHSASNQAWLGYPKMYLQTEENILVPIRNNVTTVAE